MINSKIYFLHQLLIKTKLGLNSKICYNYIELISHDNDIVEKLKALKFMQGFIVKVVIEYEGSYLIQIFQDTSNEEHLIEKKVELEFNRIFDNYKDKINFIYCLDKKTIVIESDNFDIIREIYLSLKNFDYTTIGNKHMFEYVLNK